MREKGVRPLFHKLLSAAGFLALGAVLVAQAPDDPFAFFLPAVSVSLQDRQAIDKGTPLATVLPVKVRDAACATVYCTVFVLDAGMLEAPSL